MPVEARSAAMCARAALMMSHADSSSVDGGLCIAGDVSSAATACGTANPVAGGATCASRHHVSPRV
ncbi:Uncharacterised protein [Mycobacterium tuberculosis]|nr:Uncharacterised protein [Mycobacterium tuberculosis]